MGVADVLQRYGPPSESVRRAFDVTAAGCLGVLALPIAIAAGLAVRLSDGGPALFGHTRVGRGGRPFRCWKLRTMRVDAERVLESDDDLRRRHRTNGFKLSVDEDPRVTTLGRWLRRTRLDELPQLWNVLRGDMSLVGPRPVVEAELQLFGEHARELVSVKPGIFGAWNTLGRDAPPYPERAEIEVGYVRERTLGRDLIILCRAVVAVVQGGR